MRSIEVGEGWPAEIRPDSKLETRSVFVSEVTSLVVLLLCVSTDVKTPRTLLNSVAILVVKEESILASDMSLSFYVVRK
jgi:hypothetical protein